MDLKSFFRDQTPDTKAIPSHPALHALNQQPTIVTSGPSRVRTPFGQAEASRHLNAFGGSNDAIDWVMNCVKLIAETASSSNWHLSNPEGDKFVVPHGTHTPKPEDKAPPYLLTKLFQKPNPFMTWEELVELTVIDYLLVGNSYWLKYRMNDAGQPLALYRLAPPFVEIVPGQMGPESYKYRIPGHDELELRPEQIVHFKAPNPHSPYFGLGLIQGGSRMLDTELALTDTEASYFEKRAMPSMVVQTERRVPEAVFNRLKDQLRALYGGPRNSGAMMVLEAGLKYQSIAPSAVEAGFAELSRMSRDRILALFRVPASLLGIGGGMGDSATANNSDQRVFDTKTMKPLLNKLQVAITNNVTEAWGLSFQFEHDYIMPVEERLRLASTFAALPGVKVKEVREYAGLPPLEDPAIEDIVLNLPGEEEEPGGHPKVPDNNLAGEGGRPPNPSNTRRFPANGNIPEGAAARRTSLAAADNKSYVDSTAEEMTDVVAQLEAVAAKKAMQVERPSDELESDRVQAVDHVVDTLSTDIKQAIHELERGLLDEFEAAYEGKAPGDRLRSKLRGSAAWSKFLDRFSSALQKAAKSSISAAVLQQGRQGRRPEESIDYDALAREIVYRTGGVRKITANLKDEVAQKVGKALKEGETRADVERAIREAMDFWRETHAETVALTEATHAYNEGTLSVAEMTGYTHVFVFDGHDHDEPCQEADGKVWDIAYARENRLEHPRCRRAFTPVTVPEVT